MSQTARVRGRSNQRRRSIYFARYPLCVKCKDRGLITVARQIDHIIPLCKGGSDEMDNWQGLCIPCHEAKTREDLGWRKIQEIGIDGWPTGG